LLSKFSYFSALRCNNPRKNIGAVLARSNLLLLAAIIATPDGAADTISQVRLEQALEEASTGE
jgi:hypothetical protein